MTVSMWIAINFVIFIIHHCPGYFKGAFVNVRIFCDPVQILELML